MTANTLLFPTLPAQVVRYADQASFRASVRALTSVNFNGCNADLDFTEYPDGLTVQEVHFTVSCYADFPTAVLVYSSNPCGYRAEDKPVLYAGGSEALHITLPAGTTAIGIDYFADAQSLAALSGSVNGEAFTLPVPNTCQQFLFAGFISSVPITEMDLRGTDAGPILCGICYGHAQSVSSILGNPFT